MHTSRIASLEMIIKRIIFTNRIETIHGYKITIISQDADHLGVL